MHFPLCIYHPPNAADRISESLTGSLEQSIVLQACLGMDKTSWMLTCLVFIGSCERSWRRTHSKVLSTFLCGIGGCFGYPLFAKVYGVVRRTRSRVLLCVVCNVFFMLLIW